ncbi:substrate-binding domain-containing protein [Nocardioides sp. CER19]|uniref:substrate-binding domain-containing protein n=1 Tax=Nocardioides sp. CER19 TaxID=3038538 RepID=UPI00244B85D6|nr:substrate-binding domain-containing protein [Nocardioides sp. CER19]MDH2416150.1 substrate-binding domain-containing protein [Nocardioides sp. CER19]
MRRLCLACVTSNDTFQLCHSLWRCSAAPWHGQAMSRASLTPTIEATDRRVLWAAANIEGAFMRANVSTLRQGCLVAAATLLATTLSACNSSGSGDANSTSGSNADTSKAQERLNAAYKGFYSEPQGDTPAAPTGKNVWVIPTDLSYGFSDDWAKASKDAGALLGWTIKTYDGKSDPNNVLQGIRSAIAAKADGIMIEVQDCDAIKSGLTEAKKAGIPVVGDQGQDCDPPLFSATTVFKNGGYEGNDGTAPKTLAAAFKPQADWVTVKSNGDAKIITIEETDSQAAIWQAQGVREELKDVCPGCKIVATVKYTVDQIPNLQQMISQALLQHPEATAIINTVADFVQQYGLSGAVLSSGRADKLLVTGGEGTAPGLDLIRKDAGDQQTSTCTSNIWVAYTDIDQMIRLFAGAKPATDSGNGWVLIDKDHNLPKSGACVPQVDGKPIDPKALYTKIWGK